MSIDHLIYAPADVREMDRLAIEQVGIDGYELMTRAGRAAFDVVRSQCPDARRWLILCGAGNNAGDGYVIARLGVEAQLDVTVAALSDPDKLGGDAARAWHDFQAAGGRVHSFSAALLDECEVAIDALLGTGLDRPLEGRWLAAVEALNRAARPVISVDIPSGLNGLTGLAMGAAVRAVCTTTFVGLKQGLFLGDGPDCAGDISFHDLDIPADALAAVPAALRIFRQQDLNELLPPRPRTAHKGNFGHVLVIGGNAGMGGAVRMAGEAALRAGAGLVTVATRKENILNINSYRPELMCYGIEKPEQIEPLIARASVVAIGPGLGRDDWARGLFSVAVNSDRLKVLDADALNILAEQPTMRDDWVLTPHPGEAGRLLGTGAQAVQADRLAALDQLGQQFGGVTVLKGHCTLVGGTDARPYLVNRGNPGMATAGMGDVLTGLLAGLLAQVPGQIHAAAAAAAYVHGLAGDRAAELGQRGLLATDLLPFFRAGLNVGQ